MCCPLCAKKRIWRIGRLAPASIGQAEDRQRVHPGGADEAEWCLDWMRCTLQHGLARASDTGFHHQGPQINARRLTQPPVRLTRPRAFPRAPMDVGSGAGSSFDWASSAANGSPCGGGSKEKHSRNPSPTFQPFCRKDSDRASRQLRSCTVQFPPRATRNSRS